MDQRTNELNTGGVYTAGGMRTSEQIRSDIEMRRAEMEILATSLRDRLSPREIGKEVGREVRRSLQSRKTRVVNSLASSVRDNPMPWLLIAGGLGWLIKESRESEASFGYDSSKGEPMGYGTASYGPSYGTTSVGLSSSSLGAPSPYSQPSGFTTGAGFSTGAEEHGVMDTAREKVADVTERTSEALDRGKDKVIHAKDVVADKAIHAKDVVVEKAHHVREVVTDKTMAAKEQIVSAAHRTGERLADVRERTVRQTRTTANESPILFALGVLGVGALIGLAIPTSRRENELMGPMRDDLLDQAKSKGQEVAHKVQRIAEVATSEATRRVSSEQPGDTGEKIVSVVEGAVSAARREAERQGVTGSGDGDGLLSGGSRGTSGIGTSSGMSTARPSGSSTGVSSGTSSGNTPGLSSSTSGPSKDVSSDMPAGLSTGTSTLGSPTRRTSSSAMPSSISSPGSASGSSPSSRSTSGISSSGISSPGSLSSSPSSQGGPSGSSGSFSSSSAGGSTSGPSQISSPGSPSSSDRRDLSPGSDRSSGDQPPKGPRR